MEDLLKRINLLQSEVYNSDKGIEELTDFEIEHNYHEISYEMDDDLQDALEKLILKQKFPHLTFGWENESQNGVYGAEDTDN